MPTIELDSFFQYVKARYLIQDTLEPVLVQRAGFEPANPYGKGWLIEAAEAEHSTLSPSPLTWLGDRCTR